MATGPATRGISTLGLVALVLAASCGGRGSRFRESGFAPRAGDETTAIEGTDAGNADAGSLGPLSEDYGLSPGSLRPIVLDGAPSLPPGCASTSIQGSKRPLDLYFMLDTSGSMAEVIGTGVTKWKAVKDALQAFVREDTSSEVSVSLQYFPLPVQGPDRHCQRTSDCQDHGVCALGTCGRRGEVCGDDADCQGGIPCTLQQICEGTDDACPEDGSACPFGARCVPKTEGTCKVTANCKDSDYADPAVGPLELSNSASSLALMANLESRIPSGPTPTAAALRGAVDGARKLSARRTGHMAAIVLVTDGMPSACSPLHPGGIAEIARTAADGRDPIFTFVVGVFARNEQAAAQRSLDTIAEAGGTAKAVVIDSSNNVAAPLLETFHSIRASALRCELEMPQADGGAADPAQTYVQFATGRGQTYLFPGLSDPAQCNEVDGWYATRSGGPSTEATGIRLCPGSCRTVRATPGGRLDVVLGCQKVLR